MEKNILFNLDYEPNQSFLECVDNIIISVDINLNELRKAKCVLAIYLSNMPFKDKELALKFCLCLLFGLSTSEKYGDLLKVENTINLLGISNLNEFKNNNYINNIQCGLSVLVNDFKKKL